VRELHYKYSTIDKYGNGFSYKTDCPYKQVTWRNIYKGETINKVGSLGCLLCEYYNGRVATFNKGYSNVRIMCNKDEISNTTHKLLLTERTQIFLT
jgi:hypothetical protein